MLELLLKFTMFLFWNDCYHLIAHHRCLKWIYLYMDESKKGLKWWKVHHASIQLPQPKIKVFDHVVLCIEVDFQFLLSNKMSLSKRRDRLKQLPFCNSLPNPMFIQFNEIHFWEQANIWQMFTMWYCETRIPFKSCRSWF